MHLQLPFDKCWPEVSVCNLQSAADKVKLSQSGKEPAIAQEIEAKLAQQH